MKTITLTVAAILAFASTSWAQGNGVVNQAPATTIIARLPTSDTGSAAEPHFDGRVVQVYEGRVIQTQSNEGLLQSSISMPPNAGVSGIRPMKVAVAAAGPVISATMAPSNGSGVSQTYASLPPNWTQGTVPQMTITRIGEYMAAKQARQLAALHARQAVAAK